MTRRLLVGGGIFYSSWILGLVLPTGLSQRASFASELEAAGVPWAWVFRLSDVLCGIALFVGGVRAGGTGPRLIRIGMLAVALTGLTTAIAGPLVVDCTSSTDSCAVLRATGARRSWHDVAHHGISNVSGYAFTVALIVFALAALRGQAPPVLRRWIFPLLALAALTSIPVSSLLWPAGWRGVPQRMDEAVESLVFVVAGLAAPHMGRPGRDPLAADASRPGTSA